MSQPTVLNDQPALTAILMTAGGGNPNVVARESWASAHILINRVKNNQSLHPELDIRAALSNLLNCFWVLKNERKVIAKKMHQIGLYLAQNHKCQFKFKDGNYYTDCPNMLLHKDFGFSLRGFEKYKCSVCGFDPIDCEHRTGRKYDDVECNIFDGLCNICQNEKDHCEHQIGVRYDDVEAVKIVSDLEIITYDIVKDPEMVFARVTEIPYSKDTVMKSLSNDQEFEDFKYGESPLYCLHCIDCEGYDPDATNELFSS